MSAFASAAAPSINGTWMGKLDVGNGVTLRVVIHLSTTPTGALSGSLESPDQGPGEIPLESVTFAQHKLRFRSTSLDASYEGALSSSGQSIAGTFTQHGVALPLTFKPYSESAPAGQKVTPTGASTIVGTWLGTLSVGNGSSLHLIFAFTQDSRGYLTGTLTSPDQSPQAMPAQARLVDGVVDVQVPVVGGSYHGRLHDQTIHGAWTQHGTVFPLDLTKSTHALALPDRPQMPKPPFPYSQVSATFANPPGKATLAGTLTIPSGPGPFPAAILISGSGPNDRDETIFGHKPFLVLADYLSRRGIAVLRYDKRGIGASNGNYGQATTADFASDALAAVAYLKTRKDIDPAHIGLIGHSEGGMIAPICASSCRDIAFIVMMAGDGVRGDKLLIRQIQAIGAASGTGGKDADQTTQFVNAEYDILSNTQNADPTQLLVKKAADQGLSPAKTMVLLSPWFRYMITYDPQTALVKVKCPVLAIGGSLDLQVDPEQNLTAIEAALKQGGNTDYTVKELPGLNHLFQPAKTGLPAEYAEITTTIDPSVLQLIGDWIESHVKTQA